MGRSGSSQGKEFGQGAIDGGDSLDLLVDPLGLAPPREDVHLVRVLAHRQRRLQQPQQPPLVHVLTSSSSGRIASTAALASGQQHSLFHADLQFQNGKSARLTSRMGMNLARSVKSLAPKDPSSSSSAGDGPSASMGSEAAAPAASSSRCRLGSAAP